MIIWGRYSFGREKAVDANPLPERGLLQDVISSTANLHFLMDDHAADGE